MAEMSDAEVIAALKSDTPLNRARAKFSHWAATIEQEARQRRPAGPIEGRRMEFRAVEEISEALGLISYNALNAKVATLTNRVAELESALEQCEDYFDQRSDVIDGDYGMPEPNREMAMLSVVRAAQREKQNAN